MSGSSPHLMVIEARFYDELADELVRGAAAEIERNGGTYERFAVPGAFEIPAAIRVGMEAVNPDRTPRFDGFIGLGCVIRGETSHYDYVCSESARGLMSLAVAHGLAIGYGILTCENWDQAWARAAVAEGNKGRDAVAACLSVIALRHRLSVPLASVVSG